MRYFILVGNLSVRDIVFSSVNFLPRHVSGAIITAPSSSLVYRSDTPSGLGLGVFKTMRPFNVSGRLRPLVSRRCNFCKKYPTYAGIRAGGPMALQTPPLLVWTMRNAKSDNRNNGIGDFIPIRRQQRGRACFPVIPPPFLRFAVISSILPFLLSFYRR